MIQFLLLMLLLQHLSVIISTSMVKVLYDERSVLVDRASSVGSCSPDTDDEYESERENEETGYTGCGCFRRKNRKNKK